MRNRELRSKLREEVVKTNTTLKLITKTILKLIKLKEVTVNKNCKLSANRKKKTRLCANLCLLMQRDHLRQLPTVNRSNSKNNWRNKDKMRPPKN